MKSKNKKIIGTFLSILMAISIIIGTFPMAVTAAEPTPYPESTHPYAYNYDNTWTYNHPDSNVKALEVTFDSQTKTEFHYDKIYITDLNGNNINKSPFMGTQLSKKTVRVKGNGFKIRLTSNSSGNYYGFKVIDIKEYILPEKPADTIEFKDMNFYSELIDSGVDKNNDEYITITEANNYEGTSSATPGAMSLFNDNISNLLGIEHFTKIDDFSVTNAQISDVSHLKNMVWLKKLDLSGNPLSNIDALKSLKNLTALNLDGTAVPFEEKLKFMKIPDEITLYKGAAIKERLLLEWLLTNYTAEVSNSNLIDISFDESYFGGNLHYLIILGKMTGTATLKLLSENKLVKEIKVNVIPIPVDGAEIKDINLYKLLMKNGADENKDGYISKSEMALITSIYNSNSRFQNITDLTGLEHAINIRNLGLQDNSELSNIEPIRNLKNLTYLNLAGTKVSDTDKLSFLKFNDVIIQLAGGKYIEPVIRGLFADDDFTYTANNLDVVSLITEYSNTMMIGKSIGTTTVKVAIKGIEKTFTVTVEGQDPDQSLSEVIEVPPETIYDSSIGSPTAILKANGDLWSLLEKPKRDENGYYGHYQVNPKKIKSNVKKYVADFVYETGYEKNAPKLAWCNDNSLWNGDEKVAENVKEFDPHYALTNDNTLIDFYNTSTPPISNVNSWTRCAITYDTYGTLVLKNDKSLWNRLDVSKNDSINQFVKIADNVVEINDSGFLNTNGEYWNIDFEPFTSTLVLSDVKKINTEYLIKTDGTSWNRNGKKILDTEITILEAMSWDYYAIDVNSVLWEIDTYHGTYQNKIAENVSNFIENGYELKNGQKFNVDGSSYIESEYIIGDEEIGVKKDKCFYKNGVKLLTNIVDFSSANGSNVAATIITRTDGTVWMVDFDNYDESKRVYSPKKIIDTKKINTVGISLDKTALELKTGEKSKLNVTFNPEDATNKSITWSSSDDKIASVDSSGNIMAIAKGTATITATSNDGGFIAKCTINITDIIVSGIAFNKTKATISVGNSELITVIFTPENATNKGVVWHSDNNSIATVDETGKVTAVSKGVTTIIATSKDGRFTAACEVTIVENPVTGISLDKETITLIETNSDKLSATISPIDAGNKAVNWSSSDIKVAIVDEDGKVTALSEGTAIITATTIDGEFSDSCTVTVKKLDVKLNSEPGKEATATGIKSGSTGDDVMNSLKSNNIILADQGIEIFDSTGIKLPLNSKLGTGMKIEITENAKGRSLATPKYYTVVIKGDISGDGDIDIFDVMAIRDHIFEESPLTDCYYQAAELNSDGELNIFDIMAIRDHIFEESIIAQ